MCSEEGHSCSDETEEKDQLDAVDCSGATLRSKDQGREMQSSNRDEYTIVGTDVEALFPSLKDLESARIAREAVENSGMTFENIDISAALQYLTIVGGNDHLNEIGFRNIAPRWIGKRPDQSCKKSVSWYLGYRFFFCP